MLAIDYKKNKGDTLIEVLFAISIFSLISVGSLSIMNQGADTSQRALEITLVRQEIDAQAETLRFLNASYVAAYQSGVSDYSTNVLAYQWQQIIQNNTILEASPFGNSSTCPASQPQSIKGFVLDTKNVKLISFNNNNKFQLSQTFSQVQYLKDNNGKFVFSSADGIWIEAVRPSIVGMNQANADYIDFNIRACWDSPGQVAPVTMGTIVRLYEPRG